MRQQIEGKTRHGLWEESGGDQEPIFWGDTISESIGGVSAPDTYTANVLDFWAVDDDND